MTDIHFAEKLALKEDNERLLEKLREAYKDINYLTALCNERLHRLESIVLVATGQLKTKIVDGTPEPEEREPEPSSSIILAK